ncbi:MAG: glutathione S-transferase family protein [Hyphomicrobiales bacterium]|nr:glutathione S-transferase family protein [Hyphomicrobiales bacterium]
MPHLFHHPLCPHSRFVRLALAEYGLDVELIEERVHERREDFLLIDPAGRTPVLVADGGLVVSGAVVAAEWLEEAYGPSFPNVRLMPSDIAGRVETRRLLDWFHGKMFAEVTDWLVTEKIYRRFMTSAQGGGGPDMGAVRAARANIRLHLSYIGFLVSDRNWLAGNRMTYADLAAAAHLSCADYLGDVPWDEFEPAKAWYQKMKSRPSFRTLLADRVIGMAPSAVYADLDF